MMNLFIWLYFLQQYCFTPSLTHVIPVGYGGLAYSSPHAEAMVDNAHNPKCSGDRCVMNQFGHWRTNPIDHANAHKSKNADDKIEKAVTALAQNEIDSAIVRGVHPYMFNNTPNIYLQPYSRRRSSRRRSRYRYNPYPLPNHPYANPMSNLYTPHVYNSPVYNSHLLSPHLYSTSPYYQNFPYSSLPYSNMSHYPYASSYPSFFRKPPPVSGKRNGSVTVIDSTGQAHVMGNTLLAPTMPADVAVDPNAPQTPTTFSFHNHPTFHHPMPIGVFRRK